MILPVTPHITAAVPDKLCAGLDDDDGEEGNPGKAQIMGVHKDICTSTLGFHECCWEEESGVVE